jgi:hypothetical protein
MLTHSSYKENLAIKQGIGSGASGSWLAGVAKGHRNFPLLVQND